MPCLVIYKVLFWVLRKRGDGSEDEHKLTKGNRDFNPLILAIPSFLGLIAGSLMYVGLNLTYASSYQMLRGAVIVFIALLSMVFLKRKIGLKQWTGIIIVILGLGTVGLADYVSKGSEESLNINEIITGDLLIVFAQIIAAIQFVIEEKFVAGQDMPPLQAVGWDSVFGFVMIIILHIPMYFIKADRPLTQHKGDRMEDPIDAFVQIGNSWRLQVAILVSTISVGFFNFAGVTLTKEVSATTRKVLDNIRTIIIWCFSLAFFGQQFHWLQDGAEDEHPITKGNRDFNAIIIAIPTFLGIIAGSLQLVGLNLTYASSFLMLRGGSIIFVGILSMIFLKRKLGLRHWTGITFVMLGLGTVGLADFVSKGSEESLRPGEIIMGDLLIISAQFIAGSQFVIEEKFLIGLDMPPLQAVGWGGLFGFTIITLLHIPMYFIRADRPLTQHKGDRVEDAIDALVQIGNSWKLQVAIPTYIISVGFFNFAGSTLTKELSATTRKVLDSVRTLIVWGFSLAFFGQQFHWLQLLGFSLLVFGIFLYNNIIGSHTLSICKRTEQGEESNTNTEATGTK